MSKDERIQKILESWRGSQHLKEDTWANVQLVLDYYGFSYEKKADWVCSHAEFAELVKKPSAKELLQMVGLSATGNFTVAVTHVTNRKSGRVLRCYLNNILKAVELLEVSTKEKSAMIKDLKYYMSLPYTIKVEELSDDDGGGIFMSIPLLGEMAVCAHGDTYMEARSHLELVKKDYFEMWLDAGVDIPEPEPEKWLDNMRVSIRELGLVGAL